MKIGRELQEVIENTLSEIKDQFDGDPQHLLARALDSVVVYEEIAQQIDWIVEKEAVGQGQAQGQGGGITGFMATKERVK